MPKVGVLINSARQSFKYVFFICTEKENSGRTDVLHIQGCVSCRDRFRFKFDCGACHTSSTAYEFAVDGHNFKTNKTRKTIRIYGNFINH